MDWSKIFQNYSIKNISLIGIATISGNSISVFFWLYLADVLGSENYGEISYLIGIGSIVTAISLFGSEQFMIVYSAKKVNIQPPIYIISLITCLTSAMILYFSFQNIGLSFFVLGYVLFSLSLSETLGRKLYKNYSLYYLLQKILFVFLGLLFYFLIGPEGILIGYGLSMFLLLKRIYTSIKDSKIDFNLLKSKSHFLINNYILDISSASKGHIDKLLIAPLFGFSLLGNYFLSLQILSILSIIPGIVIKYTLPEDASGSPTLKLKLYTVGFTAILCLIGIFLAPIVIPAFFPNYVEALVFVPIVSISLIPSTISSFYISKFLGMEKSNYVVIGNLISFTISTIGIIYLGSMWGTVGLAVTLVISSITQAIIFILLDLWKHKSYKKFPKL